MYTIFRGDDRIVLSLKAPDPTCNLQFNVKYEGDEFNFEIGYMEVLSLMERLGEVVLYYEMLIEEASKNVVAKKNSI